MAAKQKRCPKGKRKVEVCRAVGKTSKADKKAARKPCQTAKGKLKPGWRYGKNGRCVKAKAA